MNPQEESLEDTEVDATVSDLVSRLDLFYRGGEAPFASPLQTRSLGNLEGEHVGRYRIVKRIGFGSFGVVYRAFDSLLDREVAIKVPRFEVLLDRSNLKRFQAEALTAAKLEHSAIVQVYDADLSGEIPFISTSYCPGLNLAEFLEANVAPIPYAVIVELLSVIADAVHFAHEAGIIHRDIKPSNVMLVPKREQAIQGAADSPGLDRFEPKLTDFGLAWASDRNFHWTQGSLVLGTPLYMSPEQARGDSHPPQRTTDIFSLGAVLYHLIAGEPPFQDKSYAAVMKRLEEGDFEPLRERRPDCPIELAVLCEKCLEYDPSHRYQSAKALAEDLTRFRDGLPIHAKPLTVVRRARAWLKRPERVSEAILLVQGISLIRVSAFLGSVILFGTIPGIITTASEIKELTMFLAAAAPLEILIGYGAHRARRSRMTTWGAWLVFSLLVIGFLFAMMVTSGTIVPLQYLQRTASTRVALFAFAAAMFLAQAVAWNFVVDAFARDSKRSKRGRVLKRGVLGAAMVCATAILAHAHREWLPNPRLEPLAPATYTSFDGLDDYASFDSLGFVDNQPLTMELWMRAAREQTATLLSYGPVTITCVPGQGHVRMRMQVMMSDDEIYLAYTDAPIPLNAWSHWAFTYDGEGLQVFVDGKPQALTISLYRAGKGTRTNEVLPSPLRLKNVYEGMHTFVGAGQPPSGPNPYPFSGDLAEIRITSAKLYHDAFEPHATYEPTENTIALFHLTQHDEAWNDEARGHRLVKHE